MSAAKSLKKSGSATLYAMAREVVTCILATNILSLREKSCQKAAYFLAFSILAWASKVAATALASRARRSFSCAFLVRQRMAANAITPRIRSATRICAMVLLVVCSPHGVHFWPVTGAIGSVLSI